jgi:hypothetical protein
MQPLDPDDLLRYRCSCCGKDVVIAADNLYRIMRAVKLRNPRIGERTVAINVNAIPPNWDLSGELDGQQVAYIAQHAARIL